MPSHWVHICSVSFYYGIKWCEIISYGHFLPSFLLSFLPLSLLSLCFNNSEPIHRSLCHRELPTYLFHTWIINSPPVQRIESCSQNKLKPANINLQQEQAVEVLYWDVWAGGSELNQWRRKVTGYPTTNTITTTTQLPQPPMKTQAWCSQQFLNDFLWTVTMWVVSENELNYGVVLIFFFPFPFSLFALDRHWPAQ